LRSKNFADARFALNCSACSVRCAHRTWPNNLPKDAIKGERSELRKRSDRNEAAGEVFCNKD